MHWRMHGDLGARDRLLHANMRYVVAIARRYHTYGEDMEDLIGEGTLGLQHALDKFELERGLRFVTYAAYWIRAQILIYILKNWSSVRTASLGLRSKEFFTLRKMLAKHRAIHGEDTEKEVDLVKTFLKVSERDAAEALGRVTWRDASVEGMTSAHEEGEDAAYMKMFGRFLKGTVEDDLSDEQEQRERACRAYQLLATLDDRERYIIERRVLFEEPLTLAELGEILGVSRERVRQLEARALRKMKCAGGVAEPTSSDDRVSKVA